MPGRGGWSDVVPEIIFPTPPSLSLKIITSTDSEYKDNDQTLCLPSQHHEDIEFGSDRV